MEKELKELIKTYENYLNRFINDRDELRNKVRFCSQHKFEEDQRIAQIKINAIDGIIYVFEEFISALKTLLKKPAPPSHTQSK